MGRKEKVWGELETGVAAALRFSGSIRATLEKEKRQEAQYDGKAG